MIPSQQDLQGRELVPPAERPFVPFDFQETVQETVWFNPTDNDAVLDLHIGTRPIYTQAQRDRLKMMTPGQKREFLTGKRRFVIPAKSKRSISSDFDMAIQQTECMEPDCYTQRLYCRNTEHHKQVMGGMGPHLLNMSVQHRPVVHSSLIESNANEAATKQRAYEALLAKQAADTALAIAQAKVLEAEALAKSNEAKVQAQDRDHSPAPAASQPNKKTEK
jgi:hypothetical protein